MKNTKRYISLLMCLIMTFSAFSSCRQKVYNALDGATVIINGEEVNTVEASMGAYEGKQGDSIEFIFDEPKTINSVYVIEKTANIRQFNIYLMTDGKYKLVYTGKEVLQDYCKFNEETATALKFTVVNTDIKNNSFIIQGISAYRLEGDLGLTTLPAEK